MGQDLIAQCCWGDSPKIFGDSQLNLWSQDLVALDSRGKIPMGQAIEEKILRECVISRACKNGRVEEGTMIWSNAWDNRKFV
jgi:hypothetical protein